MLLLVYTAVEPLSQLLRLIGGEIVPGAVADHPGVGEAGRLAARGGGGDLKHPLNLTQTAIRDLDALPVAPLPEVDQEFDDRLFDRQGLGELCCLFKVGLGKAKLSLRSLVLEIGRQELGELLFVLQAVDPHADDEAVV